MNNYEIVFEVNGISAAAHLQAETKDHAANLFSRMMTLYISKPICKPFGAKFAKDLMGTHERNGHVFIVHNIEKI